MPARPGSHRYIPRSEKRELGIPVNIWDAARGYRDRRIALGEEPNKLRNIIKQDEFRREWNIWRNRNNSFQARVRAGQQFGWWQQDSSGRWRYVD